MELVEQWKEKQYASIIEMQQNTSIQLHSFQETMSQKEEEIRKLTTALHEKENLLKTREQQIQLLQQEVEKAKSSVAKTGVPKPDATSGNPDKSPAQQTASGSFLNLTPSKPVPAPNIVVEGAIPFQKRFIDWMGMNCSTFDFL